MASIEIRVQNWKDRDKNPWPEHEGKGVDLQEPTMATILERGTVGGQAAIMLSAEQKDGSILTFQLPQNIWEMISGALKGHVARWKDENRERCEGKFIKIESMQAATEMNQVFQKWSKFDSDAMQKVFEMGAMVYRCESCGSIFAWHPSQDAPDLSKSLHYKRIKEEELGTDFVPVST